MHIVLVEPEIPQNTGNIARTCALTRSCLHLVKPLGFSLEDRYLKRAGLDYWDKVEIRVWDQFSDVAHYFQQHSIYLATTHALKGYHQVEYAWNDVLVFGAESRGFSRHLREKYSSRLIRIPMLNIGRSLNLGNSVAIILYEALRQMNFPDLY